MNKIPKHGHDTSFASLRLGSRLFSALSNPIRILILVICWASTAIGQAAHEASDPAWRKFREHVPGHFQDWIVSGDGPEYTLIYAEPAPAYNLDEYTLVLINAFRGYKDHVVE